LEPEVPVVRIVQLLCPARHCILATAYESADGEPIAAIAEHVREGFRLLFNAGNLNPWCGICHSRDFHIEDGATAFRSMDEALPHLNQLQAENAATREYFRAAKG
jgi:hypothetical protein